ncbi:hypothetical protein QF028_003357 [Neobacillus sp. B4I6]|uniref:hypothetical protein n=1 Tax=Neobacillus sp. B4I6 TaxID=3373925 RepID=UPI003D249658
MNKFSERLTSEEKEKLLVSAQPLLKFMRKFYQQNQDVLDKTDEWEAIIGLSLEEMDELELWEVIQLVREKMTPREIEILDSIIPQLYIIPNNKLANELPKPDVPYNEPFNIKVNNDKEKQVLNPTIINYDDANIQIAEKDKRFTNYDRCVHNAVCSIFEAGNTNFTPDQVYRCMNGLDDSQYVSPQSIEIITASLDKLMRTYLKVDYTNEARMYRRNLVEEYIVEGYILPATKITVKAGGHRRIGYKFNGKPLLYEYAQVSRQIATVPSKLLKTKDVIRANPEVNIIKEYLLRRIEQMKKAKGKKQINRILFEKIYYETGELKPNKKKALRIRNTAKTLLTKFSEEKYIKGFKFYEKGIEISF